jgi:hypothetical protein
MRCKEPPAMLSALSALSPRTIMTTAALEIQA